MLKRLEVQNYAIIEHIGIDFSNSMNIITGETGAGKSIVMGALSLILGDRADTSVLMNREKKCFVEGTFTISKSLRKTLDENDFEVDDELVVRREISSSGKSRAFINDTPVNLELLRTVTSSLVDLHRQFDTLELGESDFQRQVLDALAGNGQILSSYQSVFSQLQKCNRELHELQQKKAQFTREFDYNKFLYDELESAAFTSNELEEAESELKLLSNSEGIKGLLTKINFELNESESPVVHQLKSLANQLHAFANYHSSIDEVCKRLSSVQIELQDISDDIERINDDINYDPQKIDKLNDRLSVGYKLLKKHNLKNTNELLVLKDNLNSKLQDVLSIDELLQSVELRATSLLDQAQKQAEQISKNRKKYCNPFEDDVNALLKQVGMPNARLKADVRHTELNAFGKDQVDFLFDANKSNKYEPIRKVASGGELSRLMLCIKSLVAESIDLPTLIFDEIDTGISGEAARQVGVIMKKLAGKRQVISITHQPQIAGKADAHFFIYKQIENDAVKTNVRLLDKEERITAIARMLSGEKPTAAALENAREMVMN